MARSYGHKGHRSHRRESGVVRHRENKTVRNANSALLRTVFDGEEAEVAFLPEPRSEGRG